MRHHRHRGRRRALVALSAAGLRDGRARHHRPGLRAACGPGTGCRADRSRRLPPRPRRSMGAGGQPHPPLSPPAGCAVAGWRAGHGARRGVLVRRVCRSRTRHRRRTGARGPGDGRGGGLVHRTCSVRARLPRAVVRRDLACADSPGAHLGGHPARAMGGRHRAGARGRERALPRDGMGACAVAPARGGARRRPLPSGGSSGASFPIPTRRSTSSSPARPTSSSTSARRLASPASRATPPCELIRYPVGGLRLPRIPGCRTRRAGGTPLLGDRALRRALAMGIDRQLLAAGIYGARHRGAPGPMSQLLWINSPDIRTPPLRYCGRSARSSTHSSGGEAPTECGGVVARRLVFDILVPGTSPTRRDLAQALQQSWKLLGVEVTITAVDFPVFNQRLGGGRVRQLHRGLARRAEPAGAGRPVDPGRLGPAELRTL